MAARHPDCDAGLGCMMLMGAHAPCLGDTCQLAEHHDRCTDRACVHGEDHACPSRMPVLRDELPPKVVPA